MSSLGSLIKLFNMWEIQLLVLLSFALQFFLFFSGSLRRRSTNMFLRISIWAAYLGADFVAVYTLGIVSRHDDITVGRHTPGKTQPLAFFWVPFLLIHLGGQDTITAFAMEDNNLWLRHLLNLVVQVVLAIYVFWKSIGRHNLELLVSGIFLFIVGIIKYGERTWSLKCGNFKSLESSTGYRYKKVDLPVIDIEESIGDDYDSIICIALRSMPYVHGIFSGRNMFYGSSIDTPKDDKKMMKMVSFFLNVMYVDLYTKALVVRKRRVIILRCIYEMSAIVAFALFHACDKQRYSRIDIAITYSLFVGGFFLELCAMFISLISPWTWAWLKARKCDRLARLSWFILSREEKKLWPKSMGQYILLSWVNGNGQARTFNQRVMIMIKWLAGLIRVEKKKLFWMSTVLDTEYVDVHKMTMECVAQEISILGDKSSTRSSRKWAHVPNVLRKVHMYLIEYDFGVAIVVLHVLTEGHLSKYPSSGPLDVVDMMDLCRKLSNYMMYLLVTHPSMLPLNVSSIGLLEEGVQDKDGDPETLDDVFKEGTDLQPGKNVLQDLVYMWARFLIYAAGKSRMELHAAELSRGGELITFTWLLMSLRGLGDFQERRIRIAKVADRSDSSVEEIYAFPDPASNQPEASSSRADEISHE